MYLGLGHSGFATLNTKPHDGKEGLERNTMGRTGFSV